MGSECASPVAGARASEGWQYIGNPRPAPNNPTSKFTQLSGLQCSSTTLGTSQRRNTLNDCLNACLANGECNAVGYYGNTFCPHYNSCVPVAGGGVNKKFFERSNNSPAPIVQFKFHTETKCRPGTYPILAGATQHARTPMRCRAACERDVECYG